MHAPSYALKVKVAVVKGRQYQAAPGVNFFRAGSRRIKDVVVGSGPRYAAVFDKYGLAKAVPFQIHFCVVN
jgi:hypothetical protein